MLAAEYNIQRGFKFLYLPALRHVSAASALPPHLDPLLPNLLVRHHPETPRRRRLSVYGLVISYVLGLLRIDLFTPPEFYDHVGLVRLSGDDI